MIFLESSNELIDTKYDYLTKHKGIYKFYVLEYVLDEIIEKLEITIDKKDVETYEYDDKKYYCVYVGQANSSNGYYGRIVLSHMKGNSTLGKSFKFILEYNPKETREFIQNKCIFILINPVDIEDTKDLNIEELLEINSKYPHILNFADNQFYYKNKENIEALFKARKLRNPI